MFTKRQTRQRAVVAGLTLIAVLVGALMLSGEVFDTTLQSAVYDQAINVATATVRNQVTIVAIDDPTIAQYGRYPLPHQAYTDLLRALKPQGASVIAFDVGFYEPSTGDDDQRPEQRQIPPFSRLKRNNPRACCFRQCSAGETSDAPHLAR